METARAFARIVTNRLFMLLFLACAFWGQLQAYREMEILMQRSLVSDTCLSHILN